MPRISDKEILEDLRRVAEKIGNSPSLSDYREHGNYSTTTCQARFDGWNNAKAAAGLSKQPQNGENAPTEEELLEDLRRVAKKIGKSPSYHEYRDHGHHDAAMVQRRFDGWNSAKAAAGLSKHTTPRENSTTEEELLEDLRRVAEKIGKSPTQDEYDTHGHYSQATYSRRFDGWNGAKEAAGLSKNIERDISDERLLEDLKRVAEILEKSPTQREYHVYGDYSPDTLTARFDGWNNAKEAAGLPKNKEFDITDEELLEDLRRVAEKISKSPTYLEYTNHGHYGTTVYARRFGGWNEAKSAAGLSKNKVFDYSNEDILRHIREETEGVDTTNLGEFLGDNAKLTKESYIDRFDGYWEAVVRAGREPILNSPLSKAEYDSYIQTAIAAEQPIVSLYGLLRAFTGMPQKILYDFNLDWVSRLYSEVQPPLIRVPSEYISAADDWEMIVPREYTTSSGEKRSTQLKSLLQWIDDTETLEVVPRKGETYAARTIITRAGLNASPPDLRGTIATHLARQGISQFEIEMQVGAEKTNWNQSVEDYFLYLYQFEGYCHPDYEPSGVYLDPDTGDVKRVDSEPN